MELGLIGVRLKSRGFIAALVFSALTRPSLAADWNVENTGQPSREVTFELTEGTWISVDVSPDGKMIAFDLLGDIFIMPASGGAARAIHRGAAMQRSPRFSPDGQWIAFVSDQNGADNIWISDINGMRARTVTNETTRNVTGPAWRHDGAAIAAARMFDTADKLHAAEIVEFDLKGGPEKLLVAAPDNDENVHEAAYARDGRALYYTEKISPPTKSVVYIDANHVNYAIKRREVATGETESILSGFGSATTPTLSPDGRLIAFIRRVKDKTVLFTYDTLSRTQRAIFDGLDRDDQADFIGQGAYYPQFSWFPDSKTVLIWYAGTLHAVDVTNGTARDVPFTATSRHKLTAATRFPLDLAPDKVRARALRDLAVSPDGARFAFIAFGQLWQTDRRGATRRLTNNALRASEPAYAPDGRSIVFAEWSDTTGATLRLWSPDGVKTLTASEGIISQPRFMPDGKTIFYRIAKGDMCLGGHRAQPGLYTLAPGGIPRLLMSEGAAAHFADSGRRLYFTAEVSSKGKLRTLFKSAAVNGSDVRIHLHADDADTREFRLSPDQRWLLFRRYQDYYVTPFDPVAADHLIDMSVARRVSPEGGYAALWSADSRSIYWLLGSKIMQARIDGGAVRLAAEPRAELPFDAPGQMLAVANGRIITMAGEQVIERGTVLIKGNRIAAVGPAEAVAIPAGTTVIDADGKTVMPGLVDMHGHLDLCYYTSSGLVPQKHPSRIAALAYGVTTNYDPYTSELPTLIMDEMVKTGLMTGPRAIDVGAVMYGRGKKSDGVFIPINDYADAEAAMRRKNALGVNIIKSYRQPMRRQRQQLIKAGREHRVMVDVEGESGFYNNLTMIIDGHVNLQHNMPVAKLYQDVVKLMAASDVTHTPTLIVLFGELMGENYIYQNSRFWNEPKARTYLQSITSGYSPLNAPSAAPAYVRGMTTIQADDSLWEIGFKSMARSVNALDRAGVTINVGSHGQAAGIAMHWEMELLAQGGMPLSRVLKAATINGARTLGVSDQIGSLEPGKLADLIVLDKDPLTDIRNSDSVRYTVVNGRVYDAFSMDELGAEPKPREPFYWELGRNLNGIDWKPVWAER